MKQELLRGFGAPYLSGQLPPDEASDEVVTMCAAQEAPQAVAIRVCLKYAKRRFGYKQGDVARLCGWDNGNHLSSYANAGPDGPFMPVKHWDRFAQVTATNLFEQVRRRVAQNAQLEGQDSPNKREEVAVEIMLSDVSFAERRAA